MKHTSHLAHNFGKNSTNKKVEALNLYFPRVQNYKDIYG